jgi:hypothetical protein
MSFSLMPLFSHISTTIWWKSALEKCAIKIHAMNVTTHYIYRSAYAISPRFIIDALLGSAVLEDVLEHLLNLY